VRARKATPALGGLGVELGLGSGRGVCGEGCAHGGGIEIW